MVTAPGTGSLWGEEEEMSTMDIQVDLNGNCFSQDGAKIYFPQLYSSSLWRANLQFWKFPVYFPLSGLNPEASLKAKLESLGGEWTQDYQL